MEFMPSSQWRKKLSIFSKKINADIITHYGMQVKISKTRGMYPVPSHAFSRFYSSRLGKNNATKCANPAQYSISDPSNIR